VIAPDGYKPLQSGEYTVTYTKTVAGGGEESCNYPLFVGAPGLRVELTWEHDLGGLGVDLDLHVHQPGNTLPWGGDSGNSVDCAWTNCTAFDCMFGGCPSWFSGLMPPEPMKWYLDPVPEKNTCYYGPNGSGDEWKLIGLGCHNPRLDVDNVTCDPTETDSDASDFCAPENINIDFPPTEQWTRIGVHYYSSNGHDYDVHPVVKIHCNGYLAAEVGPENFHDPPQPVTFTPGDSGTRFWLVADVLFRTDQCESSCFVEPLYDDDVAKTPLHKTVTQVKAGFSPGYPPIP
jgi:hypothetical protein